MALAVGTRVGPYEIHSVLGAGGMGELYRAHDTKLQRDVALKILASAVLMVVGAGAVLPTARRAARTDPLIAFRSE